MKHLHLSAAPVALSLAFAAAFASPAFAGPDHDDIVVTAPLEGTRIESVQGTQVLRRDDIIQNLNGGLGESLSKQPGISTTFFGAGASRPIIRGLGEDRVRVLENGIGAIDASTASPDHAVTADGLDASRIEILRGAAALAYGGNAVGGVVNVIDDSIPTRARGKVYGDALASYSTVNKGTQGAINLGAEAGGFALTLSGSARETEDYDIPGFSGSDGTGADGKAPNSWTSLRTAGIGASKIGDWGFIGAAVKNTSNEYGIPPEAVGEPGGHIEMDQTRYESRGDFKVNAGIFNRLDYGFQYSDYEHTEFEGDGAPGTRFESKGWEGRVEAHHGEGKLKGAIGLQYSDVDFAAFGDEAFITPTTTKDIGVFVIERWDNESWGLEGGARYERRELDNELAGKRTFDSGSASGSIFVRPLDGLFVSATAAYTQRAPTQIELFSDGPHLATANYEVGDSSLKQEKAFSIELSTRYDKGPWSVELNVFNMEFDNYIALLNRGDVWFSNEGLGVSGFAPAEDDPSIPADSDVLPVYAFSQRNASFTGGEFSVKRELFEALSFKVSGDAQVSIVNASFDGGGRPPRIPPRAALFGVTAENVKWTGRVEVQDVAKQKRTAEFESETDGYTFLNARLAFRPFGEEKDLTLSLDARNLTDEEARVHASFLKDELPLPGRDLRFTISSSF